MPSLWVIAGNSGHAVASVLLASLAILTSRQAAKRRERQILVVALAVTALWSLRFALGSVLAGGDIRGGVAETVRNGAWLAYLGYLMLRSPAERRKAQGRKAVLTVLGLLLLTHLGVNMLIGDGTPINQLSLPFFEANWLLRASFALGALYLLHGMSNQRDHPAFARREAWLGAALAFMWAFDFNYYAMAWLSRGVVPTLGPMRGFVVALSAIMLALALRSDGTRAFSLSRSATSRLISSGIIIVYVLVVALLASLSTALTAPFGRVALFAVLFSLAVAVLALMPSASLLSWIRVEISKHLFAHRYDYRLLWLRFAETVAEGPEPDQPLDTRITRAIAQAVEAPSAILYLCDEQDGGLRIARSLSWPEHLAAPLTLPDELAARMSQNSWVIDLEADWQDYGRHLPDWMQGSINAWALAPLLHGELLLGAILLGTPPGRQRVDWEDLDVLRVVCGEAAARIAEARSRAALAELQRFEEFNRRFAFILHDLKNLVSQMSLLASTAQRHADNPAFREDMVLTLKETSTRMTELLQRLGRPDSVAEEAKCGIDLGSSIRALAQGWAAGVGLVEVEGDVTRPVPVNLDGLSRALDHLVRNAIEASPAGRVVMIRVAEGEEAASIHVIDGGCGMNAEFVKNELFRPFSSTKSNGFGLGAHEARTLVQNMGGQLEVESVEGKGTCFTIRLPFAGKDSGNPRALPERERKVG